MLSRLKLTFVLPILRWPHSVWPKWLLFEATMIPGIVWHIVLKNINGHRAIPFHPTYSHILPLLRDVDFRI